MLVILKSNYRYIIVDLLIFLILFLLPSIAHLFPFPIYLIEPMRIAVFIGYLLTKNTYNVAFLAFTIPLFSYLTTGHPLFFKALLISIILANARALTDQIGAPPILLLDEVAAHLDAQRRAALYAEINTLKAQAWMTGTGPELFEDLGAAALMLELGDSGSGSFIKLG